MVKIELTVKEAKLILNFLCMVEFQSLIEPNQKVLGSLINKIGTKLTAEIEKRRCDDKIKS